MMELEEDETIPIYSIPQGIAECDPVFKDHKRFSRSAIVIDQGTSETRVGYASENQPRLMFPSIVSKTRSKKGDSTSHVGNDVLVNTSTKTAGKVTYEDGIIINWDLEEHLLDHCFSCLGINESRVNNAVVMTEVPLNPNLSRGRLSEMIFELYGAPSLMLGIDALFSLYHNQPDIVDNGTCLVASSGYHASFLMPVVNGAFESAHMRRIDVAGQQVVDYGTEILASRYPAAAVTPAVTTQIIAEYGCVAENFTELVNSLEDTKSLKRVSRRLQLPIDMSAIPTEQQLEDKAKKRDELIVRMKSMHSKRDSRMLVTARNQLEKYKELIVTVQKYSEDEDARKAAFKKAGFRTQAKFCSQLEDLDFRVTRLTLRVEAETEDEQEDDITKDLDHYFALAEGETVSEAVAALCKEMSEKCKQLREKRIESERQALIDKAKSAEAQLQDPDAWAAKLRAERQALQDELLRRQKTRDELQDRKSAASKNRMRLLVQQQAGGGGKPPTKQAKTKKQSKRQSKQGKKQATGNEDLFGADDDDWQVYATLNEKQVDDEENDIAERISQLDNQLEEHSIKQAKLNPETREDIIARVRAQAQVVVDIERFRVPEILFQPPLYRGRDQGGVVASMDFVLASYGEDIQKQLCKNVFLTGGATAFQNFEQRVQAELTSRRPFKSEIKVTRAADPRLDAWRGAALWASDKSRLAAASITKAQYEEHGAYYLQEHFASNPYIMPLHE